MTTDLIFDIPWALYFNKKRQSLIEPFLIAARQQTNLDSALDVGCGVGHFSRFLHDLGFRVVAVDGREENIVEARRRHPFITFIRRDLEDLRAGEVGIFEFTLCVGLLYHLENPFRVIRNLCAVTEKILLIESMCLPTKWTAMDLLDEGVSENQGLNYVAFYPSESCLVKMLYRAGFPYVYRFRCLPEDPQFQGTMRRRRSRTFLAATKIALKYEQLELVPEPVRLVLSNSDPWTTALGAAANVFEAYWMALKIFGSRVLRSLGRKPRSASNQSDTRQRSE